jgi:hypothetical protein
LHIAVELLNGVVAIDGVSVCIDYYFSQSLKIFSQSGAVPHTQKISRDWRKNILGANHLPPYSGTYSQ